MPIYEYRCSSCGFQKEYLQKISDPVLSTCPECGKNTLSKMLTAAGFQLKGSGWYATDFRNPKPAAKGDGKGDAKPDTKSDAKPDAKSAESAKADAKPEAKSEPKPATKSAPAANSAGSSSS